MMLYELTMIGTYASQLIVNRFNYVSAGSLPATKGSAALLAAVGMTLDQTPPVTTTVVGAWLACVVDDFSITGAMARAIYDNTDFAEIGAAPLVFPGGITGVDGASPTVALGLRTNRIRQDIGRGMKRFVGVSETDINNLGLLSTSMATAAANLATRMSATLTVTEGANSITFAPVVVKKLKYLPEGSEKYAYKYYPDEEDQLENLALNPTWEAYPQTRTQRSRQYGHGA